MFGSVRRRPFWGHVAYWGSLGFVALIIVVGLVRPADNRLESPGDAYATLVFAAAAYALLPLWGLSRISGDWRPILERSGLQKGSWPWAPAALACLAPLALLLAINIPLILLGTGSGHGSQASLSTWTTLWLFIPLAALFEEVFWRGLVLPRFGAVASVVGFALPHAAAGWLTLVVALAAGWGFVALWRRTRNTWLCAAAHALYNALQFLFVRLLAGAA